MKNIEMQKAKTRKAKIHLHNALAHQLAMKGNQILVLQKESRQ